MITLDIPGMRLPSASNLREHWAKRAGRTKKQRHAIWLAWRSRKLHQLEFPWTADSAHVTVTLTRIGPRRLDDDNLAASFKATRDQVAAELGIDDGSERLEWRYRQEKGAYGIRVEIA